jgi:hypothetical protein
VEDEDVFLVQRCCGLDAGISGEVGEEGAQAVDRQAVLCAAGCLLAGGGAGALDLATMLARIAAAGSRSVSS